jgi:hypothetical protein
MQACQLGSFHVFICYARPVKLYLKYFVTQINLLLHEYVTITKIRIWEPLSVDCILLPKWIYFYMNMSPQQREGSTTHLHTGSVIQPPSALFRYRRGSWCSWSGSSWNYTYPGDRGRRSPHLAHWSGWRTRLCSCLGKKKKKEEEEERSVQ